MPRTTKPSSLPPAAATSEVAEGAVVDRQEGMKSLANGLRMVEILVALDHEPTIAELAELLGISRPAVYRLARTFFDFGYLTRDPRSQRLSLGLELLRPASKVLDNHRLRVEAIPRLQELARTVGERTTLGILHRGQAMTLASIEKPSLPTIYTRFGKLTPVHCCGIGKAILTWLPEDEIRTLAGASPMPRRTPNTITDIEDLIVDLAATRSRGFAIDRGENTAGTNCVAAAILDADNRPLAAISISTRSGLDNLLPNATHLMQTAEEIAHLFQR